MGKCFYQPGKRHIIDTMDEQTGLSTICKENLEQIRSRCPRAEIWDTDTAFEEIERLNILHTVTAPVEITKERYWKMLEILPPMKWVTNPDTESFMISEAMCSHYHSIFCQVGDRYFEMTDSRFLTHDQILDKVKPLM